MNKAASTIYTGTLDSTRWTLTHWHDEKGCSTTIHLKDALREFTLVVKNDQLKQLSGSLVDLLGTTKLDFTSK